MFKRNYVSYIIIYVTLLLTLLVGFSVYNSFDFTKKEVIKVGTSPDYPPLEFKEKQKLVGFDIDLVNQIARVANFKVEYKEINFDNLISSIQNNKIDLIASGFSKNAEREKVVNFSKPYLSTGNIIVGLDDQKVNLSDIKNAKIGVLAGSTQLEILKKIKATNIKVFDNDQVVLKALEAKNIDYVYTGASEKIQITKHYNFKVNIDEQTPFDNLALAITKQNPKLKTKIDQAIKKLYQDKVLQKLAKK